MATVSKATAHTSLKPESARKFLRARSSREENREIVRNLLRGTGVETVAAEAARSGVTAALSHFDDNPERFDSDPGRYATAFASLLGPTAERASRPATKLEWQAPLEWEIPTRSNAS